LDGEGDHIRLSLYKTNNINEFTIEIWANWHKFGASSTCIEISRQSQTLGIGASYPHWTAEGVPNLEFYAFDERKVKHVISVPNILKLNKWFHLAAVSSQEGMKFYLNGLLIGENSHTPIDISNQNEEYILVGHANEENNYEDFEGRLDEIRLWQVARSVQQIQETMSHELKGTEPELASYWNFEGENQSEVYSNANNESIQIIDRAKNLVRNFPTLSGFPTVVSGIVSDQSGMNASQVTVSLKQNAKTRIEVYTSDKGQFRFVTWMEGEYDLYALREAEGAMKTGLRLQNGKPIEINLQIKPALSISGQVLNLDSIQPHVSTQIQAVMLSEDGNEPEKVMVTTLTNTNGEYNLINLKPGQYKLCVYTTQGSIYYQDGKILQVEAGKTIENINFRVPGFKKGKWETYTRFDGLAGNDVRAIHQDTDGMVWFATNNGISRYDGEVFENFNIQDGLAGNNVWAIYREPEGDIWFGSWDGGISKYDGEKFETFPELNEGPVAAIEADSAGNIWFGGGYWGIENHGTGLWRYDGRKFDQFTSKDG